MESARSYDDLVSYVEDGLWKKADPTPWWKSPLSLQSVRLHSCAHVYTCTMQYMCIHTPHTYTHTYTHHTRTHIHTPHMYTHTHTHHTCTHIHTPHMYTHTYTHHTRTHMPQITLSWLHLEMVTNNSILMYPLTHKLTKV